MIAGCFITYFGTGQVPFLMAGRYFERLGRIDEAVDHFQKAVLLAPNVWVNDYSLGKALAISGRTEEGLDHLYIARQLAPEGSDVALKIVENQIKIMELDSWSHSGGMPGAGKKLNK